MVLGGTASFDHAQGVHRLLHTLRQAALYKLADLVIDPAPTWFQLVNKQLQGEPK